MDPKTFHAVKDVGIVVAGVVIVWLGLRFAFATDNPFYVVSSGSMEPVLNVYDVLIVRDGSTFEKVQRGDIIVFNRPEIHDRVIVHRVVDIRETSEKILTTKGDANPSSIPGTDYPITKADYIGKVVYVIPKIGYVTRLINPPINYIIIAIILLLLFFNRTSRTKKAVTGIPDSDAGTYRPEPAPADATLYQGTEPTENVPSAPSPVVGLCKKCGFQNEPAVKYCSKCGTTLGSEDAPIYG